MHMCFPIMEAAFEGACSIVVESIMGEHMCIKYARVCILCLGLMNPLSIPGQDAVLDMYAAVGWTTRIPAQAHIGHAPAVRWSINISPTKGMIPTGHGYGYIKFGLP